MRLNSYLRVHIVMALLFFSLTSLIEAQEASYFQQQQINNTIVGPNQTQLNQAYNNVNDWLYALHDYSGKRFVQLDQIDTSNVQNLSPVCAFQAGDKYAFHTNPIVYQGIMYLTTRYDLIAIDAKSCREYWRRSWDKKRETWAQANRGVAIKDGKVIWGTANGQLMAVNATSGELSWKRSHADRSNGEKFNMPPILFEDLAIIGVAGSESGIRGWIGAFNLETGKEVWKFNIIPEKGEPAAASWGSAEALKNAGGAVWTPITLDPEKGHLFVGTANPAPAFEGKGRPGDNLYTNTLAVLDVNTGKLLWHNQLVPHDIHDRGVTAPGPLYSATIEGREHSLVATAGKDGMVRILDRETHDILFQISVTKQLNTKKGLNAEGVRVCPGLLGGVQWNGPSYHPKLNALYVPSVKWCTTYKTGGDPEIWPSEFIGGSFEMDPVEESHGWLNAINASTGEMKWRYKSEAPMVSAVTTTSGGVVFTGETSGDFLALNAKTGKVLYRFYTGGALNGGVITYKINSTQYVAATSGGMTPFWQRPPGSSTVFIFALSK